MNLDIHTAVQTAFFLAIIGVILSVLFGIRSIRAGQKLLFFRKRRDYMVRGWRLITFGFGLGITAFLLNGYAEPVAYTFFPPSPTITLTPTITITPTITLTSTITLTPTITETPSISPTPAVPESVIALFEPTVVTNNNALVSSFRFTNQLDDEGQPLYEDEQLEFSNPIGKLFATFSFDQMLPGSQWTAIWYRVADQFMICMETEAWQGSTGGYGYTECEAASPEMWLPGEYEVQMFIGYTWQVSGRFSVTGDPPTATPTVAPTATKSPTPTKTRTATITDTPQPPTITSTPTRTPVPPTATITRTPTPRPTLTPSRTPLPTSTHRPTFTPSKTNTRAPTPTLTPSPTRRN